MKFLNKEWKGKCYKLYAQRNKNSLWIHYRGQIWVWKNQKLLYNKQKQHLKRELVNSILPGRVHKIFVEKGDKVKKGQNLLILSAKKIEYNFKAEGKSQVEELFCKPGQTVKSGQELIKIKYMESKK